MTKAEDLPADHRTSIHLTGDLLVRAVDDELSPAEIARVQSHLTQCDGCTKRYETVRALSHQVEAFSAGLVLQASGDARERLVQKLDFAQPKATSVAAAKVLRRFGLGMAIAATLALGIVFGPSGVHLTQPLSSVSSARSPVETLEVNGETFVTLPDSNPDLRVSSSHIVQMQVPVSSLTDAGVSFEPISTQETALDHSVLADILVGMDGQPLGVHVLSGE